MPKERLSQASVEEANALYAGAITNIERVCSDLLADHRFVGGTLTDLLNPTTEADVDFSYRRIILRKFTPPQMFRTDGSVKDVDIICFPVRLDKFKKIKTELKILEMSEKMRGHRFPRISIETSRGLTIPKANEFRQITSGIEYEQGSMFLTYDHVKQEVKPLSMQPWTIKAGSLRFTTLSPYAHILRYCMRVPSGIKAKDKEKIPALAKLAVQVKNEAEKHGLDYQDLYKPWIDFIATIKHDTNISMLLKRALTKEWWTIGTAVAHGRGVFGPLAQFGDKFTG